MRKVHAVLGQAKPYEITLLVISVAVFYAIVEPSKPGPMPVPMPGSELETIWEEYQHQVDAFYDALYAGRIEEYEGAFLNKQWSFDYDQERLLVTNTNKRQEFPIVIKRKDVADGKVNVAIYTAAPPVAHSSLVNLPEVRLSNNQLEITGPQPTHVLMVRFFQDFTATQFTGESFKGDRGFFYISQQQVIYLQIPLDLKIDTDSSTAHIYYIDN